MQALNRYDFIIIGAGLAGCVAARELTDRGAKCLVIERRNHIGGNCYSYKVGPIDVHMYGPHIFHTNKKELWDYVNKFWDWKTYYHKVKSRVGDELYDFPPNLNTLKSIFGSTKVNDKIKRKIYDIFYAGYTKKAWGGKPPPFDVMKRIPIKKSKDNKYWSDKYQGLPVGGYGEFFDALLVGIDVILNTKFSEGNILLFADRIIYSGRVDSFGCDIKGHPLEQLPFKGVGFDTNFLSSHEEYSYKTASVNYADKNHSFLRSMEWKYFTNKSPVKCVYTVVTDEYYDKNGEDYPIVTKASRNLWKKYAARLGKYGITLIGRSGLYKYMNMDETIESTLEIVGGIK